MKATKLAVSNELKRFVNGRYTIQYIFNYLVVTLKNIQPIKVSYTKVKTKDLIDDEDYRIDFVIYFAHCEVEGSIWFLKTRTNQLFITEFNID